MSHLFDWIQAMWTRHFWIPPNIPKHSFGVWFSYGNNLILSDFPLRLVMRTRAVSNVDLIDSHWHCRTLLYHMDVLWIWVLICPVERGTIPGPVWAPVIVPQIILDNAIQCLVDLPYMQVLTSTLLNIREVFCRTLEFSFSMPLSPVYSELPPAWSPMTISFVYSKESGARLCLDFHYLNHGLFTPSRL